MVKPQLYIRNIVFGIADSLISTVGLLAGINVSGANRSTIILTGVVYAFVEAFSMAVGSFLSEESTEEYEAKKNISLRIPLLGGVVIFVTFVVVSFIPIAPYIFASLSSALPLSIILSMIALFIVGLVSARLSRVNLLRNGIKMAFLGGAAIVIGVVVGKLIK